MAISRTFLVLSVHFARSLWFYSSQCNIPRKEGELDVVHPFFSSHCPGFCVSITLPVLLPEYISWQCALRGFVTRKLLSSADSTTSNVSVKKKKKDHCTLQKNWTDWAELQLSELSPLFFVTYKVNVPLADYQDSLVLRSNEINIWTLQAQLCVSPQPALTLSLACSLSFFWESLA